MNLVRIPFCFLLTCFLLACPAEPAPPDPETTIPDPDPPPEPVLDSGTSTPISDAGATPTPISSDAGATSSTNGADSGNESPLVTIDAGSDAPSETPDAGTDAPTTTHDAGPELPTTTNDAGSELPAEPQDAGPSPHLGLLDAGTDDNSEIVEDAGTSLPSDWVEDCAPHTDGALNTACVFETLSHNCSACHMAGNMDYFKDLQTFQTKIVEDPLMIAPGLPESSQFYLLLVDQGMATSNQGYTQMPPYPSFEALASSGETHISLNNVYDWILNLETPSSETSDAGPAAGDTDAGSATPNAQNIDPLNCGWESPTTPLDDESGDNPEADDEMTHELLITISDANGSVLPGAQVRILPRIGTTTVVSCGTDDPGLTDTAGQVLCRLQSSQAGEIGVDVEAYSNAEQGWTLVFDYVALSFSPCVDAKDYFVHEVMGPIFKKCLGCHNEYGLAQEWTQYTGVDIWKGKFEGTPGAIAHNISFFQQKGSLMYTKPAGLVPTASYGPEVYFDLVDDHGGGIIIDDRETAVLEEMVNRSYKTCPDGETNYDLLGREDIGITRYSDTELYRRATFTFTSHYPEPNEFRTVLNESNFNRNSLIEKTYPAYALSSDPNPGSGAGNNLGDTSNMGSESETDSNSGFMPILDRPEFYTRLGEVIEDMLMLRDTKEVSLTGLESLYERVYPRRNSFRNRYDRGVYSKACLTKADWYSGHPDQREAECFPNIPTEAPTQENQAIDLTGDLYAECLERYGCCEEIGNDPATSHLIPKKYDVSACDVFTDAESCNNAAGCYFHSEYDTLDNYLNQFYNCTSETGCTIEDGQGCEDDDGCGLFTPVGNGQDEMEYLRIKYYEKENADDKTYGYCFWSDPYPYPAGNSHIELLCYKDAVLTWAENLDYLENDGALGVADIILPVETAIFYTIQRDFDERGNYANHTATLPVPGECRHNFCANGFDWADRDMQSQSNELANYILEHPNDPYFNNDFSKVLTSEHYVMNPYTAFVMGMDITQGHHDDGEDKLFEDPMSRNEWVAKENLFANGNTLMDTKTNEWKSHPEHAGWLTMGTFLRRYQNMITNHNRQRSKEVYDKFLDIDILDLVEFTVSADDDLPANPTFEAFSCRVCHAAMDPLGAHFKNYSWPGHFVNWTYNPLWSDRAYNEDSVSWLGHGVGYYYDLCADGDWAMAEEGETPCVRRPGYKGSLLNLTDRPHDTANDHSVDYYGSSETALRSMGEKIVTDERFSLAIARWLHESYLGLTVLSPPQDRAHPNYRAQVMAYMAQSHEIEKVRQIFVNNGNDLRAAITGIITGNLYNIKKVNVEDEDIKLALDIAAVGGGQRIIPEQLHRRILATTGYPWNYRNNNHWYNSLPMLLETSWYRLMYGGIDYRDVIVREREPTVISTLIARKMSADMACVVAPYEFSYRNPSERKLFQYVDIETLPSSTLDDGVFLGDADDGESAIRSQLQWLYLNFFGEDLDANDAEIEALYNLFTNVVTQTAIFNEGTYQDQAAQALRDDIIEEEQTLLNDMNFGFVVQSIYHMGCLITQAGHLNARTYWQAIEAGTDTLDATAFNLCATDPSLYAPGIADYFPLDNAYLLESDSTIDSEAGYHAYIQSTGLTLLGYEVADDYENGDYLVMSKQTALNNNGLQCPQLETINVSTFSTQAINEQFLTCIDAYLMNESGLVPTAVDLGDQSVEEYTQSFINQARDDTHTLSSKCEALKLFDDVYTDLDNVEGRRRVTTDMDTHGTIAAWQAVLMALLSDYHFLYE